MDTQLNELERMITDAQLLLLTMQTNKTSLQQAALWKVQEKLAQLQTDDMFAMRKALESG